MKSFLVLIVLFCAMQITYAQTTKESDLKLSVEIGKIVLSVVMPEKLENLDNAQVSKLQSKLMQIVSTNGLSASGYSGNFVIYPKFAVNDTSTVEGGMENIVVVTCEFSMYIKEIENNVLYASVNKQLKGSGKNKELAITNALQQINSTEVIWKTFIENGKVKITQYYKSKCDDMIAKSDALLKTEEFEKAIALLLTMPEEIPSCYNRVQEKAIEIYKAYKEKLSTKHIANARIEFEKGNFVEGFKLLQRIEPSTTSYPEVQKIIKQYQEKLNLQLIVKANAAIAVKDYFGATQYLKEINPEANGFKEAQEIIKEINSKTTEIEKRELAIKEQRYKDQLQMQKDALSSMKEIAIEFAKNQPKTMTYNLIVK